MGAPIVYLNHYQVIDSAGVGLIEEDALNGIPPLDSDNSVRSEWRHLSSTSQVN